jgi:DNA replication protein DnaC
LGLLVQNEKTYRENFRLKRLLHNAKLKQNAALEDIDYKHPRGLNKQTILELCSAQWLLNHRHVLLTGPTGVGKSYIVCALGNLAAPSGYTVLYLCAHRLSETLLQAQGDGSHLKNPHPAGQSPTLILDDLFIFPLADAERKDLLEIIEDRHAQAATVITSQYPTKEWHHVIGEPTIADAICDRLLHHSYKIELKGESIRKNKK